MVREIIPVFSSSVHDWRYVSEGGATIVFAYVGPPNTRFDGFVLRLRKASYIQHSVDADEKDDPILEYQRSCMQRLIPQVYLPELRAATVSPEWLEQLVALSDFRRPAERRSKDSINLARTNAVLATDLIGRQGIVVEIKPKWGFLPSPTYLSSASCSIKLQTCRFCMHSYMKATAGDAVATNFCPLDLFSMDEARISKAIGSLWNTWIVGKGATNSLKVFTNGELLNPTVSLGLLASELAVAEDDVEALKTRFLHATTQVLSSTPVLRILSRLQRTLDCLDIEGISVLWKKAHDGIEDSDIPPIGAASERVLLTNPTTSGWNEIIDMYLSTEHQNALNHAQPPVEHLRYYLLAYVLSATFKDCSLLMRIDQGHERVVVIDLDPKDVKRLGRWEALDRDIVSHYSKVCASERKICIDEYPLQGRSISMDNLE